MKLPVIETDFSKLEGTGCYCSDEAAEAIRTALSAVDIHAVHLLGSGDRHYVSLFLAEKIREPFTLVLLDNHPDDQAPAFGEEVLSCGGWVRNVRGLPLCRGTLWYDGKGEAHRSGECAGSIYVSVDLDILDRRYYTTDWDQGSLSPGELFSIIRSVADGHTIIGADVCGAPDASRKMTTCELNANSTVLGDLLGILNETSFRP